MLMKVEDIVVIAMVSGSRQSHLEYASYCLADPFCRVPDLAARPSFSRAVLLRPLGG